MKPQRILYTVRRRGWLGIPKLVLTFRTAVDLYSVPGLMIRLKQAFGQEIRRAS